MSIKRKSNPYDFPVSQAEKSLPKEFRFQAVVAPERRRLCLNFTPNHPLTAPQISPLISYWLFAEESSSCRLWQLPAGGCGGLTHSCIFFAL
jgi:hypothetical protein